jgi:hypothetical protein
MSFEEMEALTEANTRRVYGLLTRP